MFSLLLAFTLSKVITRLAATWKGKGAFKKSALKKGSGIDKRIENLYSIKDLVNNSNAREKLVVESP
jgi:hypothetical protein